VQQRGEDAENLPLLLDRDPDRREGLLRRRKLFGVVDARDRERVRAALVQVRERRGRLEPERLAFRSGGAGEELVKDVIVALRLGLVDETRPLEEVSPDPRADDGLTAVKEDLKSRSPRQSVSRVRLVVSESQTYLDVLSEAGRVVVARRFGVTERFHDRIGRQDLLLDFRHPGSRRLLGEQRAVSVFPLRRGCATQQSGEQLTFFFPGLLGSSTVAK
jgi:hypothetical protein